MLIGETRTKLEQEMISKRNTVSALGNYGPDKNERKTKSAGFSVKLNEISINSAKNSLELTNETLTTSNQYFYKTCMI